MATTRKINLSNVEDLDAAINAVTEGLAQQATAVSVTVAEMPAVEDPELLGKPFGQKWVMTEEECIARGIDPKLAATPEELTAAEAKTEKKTKKGTRKAKADEEAKAIEAAKAKALIEEAFNAAKKADPVVEAAVAPKPVVVVNEPADDTDLLAEIMLGDDKAFWDEMVSLRTQAYQIHNEAKAANVWDLQRKAEKEAESLSNMELKNAERVLFNQFKGTPYEPIFLDLQKAYREGTSDIKAKKFEALRNAKVGNDPEMKRHHVDNLHKAAQIMHDFETKKTIIEDKFEEARKLFADANEIAKLYGWPVTEEKRKKEVVNS